MKKIAVLILCVLFSLIPLCAFAASVVQMPVTISFPYGDRAGEYTGETMDNIPSGYGMFTTQNSSGVSWYYIGNFENGIFSGEGVCFWPALAQAEYGTYENGILIKGTQKYSDNGWEFVGDFTNTGATGNGTVTDYHGNVLYVGDFENGEYLYTNTPTSEASANIENINITAEKIMQNIALSAEVSALMHGSNNAYDYDYFKVGIAYENAAPHVYCYSKDGEMKAIAIFSGEIPNGTISGLFNSVCSSIFTLLGEKAPYIEMGNSGICNNYKWQSTVVNTGDYKSNGGLVVIAPIGSNFNMSAPPGIAYAPVSTPAPTPYNPSTISAQEYRSIYNGMTYDDVAFIVGSYGVEIAEASAGGNTAKSYSWDGEGSVGANAIIIFTNGVVSSKAQSGLEW